MRKIRDVLKVFFGLALLFAFSLYSLGNVVEIPQDLTVSTLIAATEQTPDVIVEDINDMSFQDNLDIYQYDDPGSVVTMYATVRKGNPSDGTDHTWAEVNDFTKWFFEGMRNIEVGKTEVLLQIGDENGPVPGEVGYGALVPNGTIQIRGASSSRGVQKSYKIELFNSAGLWRGQRTIALNKHIYDDTRVLNKLNYDLMKDIPNLVSLRTQFVHLYVKDETSSPPGKDFEDYGLFTQIEQPNGRFLENHLLDSNGQLYKATFFEFYRYEDELRLADDPLYDEEAFATVLEIKGNKDHSKLIQMLDDVNNYAIPIEQTFEKYFDAENFLTWKAFNILVGNIDVQNQNFYLYSPQYGQKWYFLAWDYDGTFSRQYSEYSGSSSQPLGWEVGIANEWVSILHQRVFKVEKYRDQLTEKVEELKQFLTPERIIGMLATYKSVADQYVTRMPDILHLGATPEEYEYFYKLVPTEIDLNYSLYMESLDMPMPFYMGIPQIGDNQIEFVWEESYDFDGQSVSYEFEVSRNWNFSGELESHIITGSTSVSIPLPEPGAYFWRVIATNEDGKSQTPFDLYRDAEGDRHEGMKYFYITADNQVLES